MALIGYTCPYIPVEILSATGLKPYCLLHGDMALSQQGETHARVDACPFVRSNLAYIIINQKEFRAIVGSTACDMARRMFDIIDEVTDIPVYVVNNPRTDNQHIYNGEIDWLVKELEHLSNKKLSDAVVSTEIDKWEDLRNQFRQLDKKRAATPSLIPTSHFYRAAMDYYKGCTDTSIPVSESISDKPRVYLIGSEITYGCQMLFDLVEQELRIVGDFNCGVSRFLNIVIEEKTLDGIKEAYYKQPPSIFKRPNHRFYDHIKGQLKTRACDGIIVWTLDYCDSYEFELGRMEEKFGVPLLRIKSDLSFQNISQLKTRIAAFREMLCSKL